VKKEKETKKKTLGVSRNKDKKHQESSSHSKRADDSKLKKEKHSKDADKSKPLHKDRTPKKEEHSEDKKSPRDVKQEEISKTVKRRSCEGPIGVPPMPKIRRLSGKFQNFFIA